MSDLISRQAAIDALEQQAREMSRWSERYMEQTKGVLTAINIINDLPSSQPERKIGHWILSDVQSEEELRNNNYLYYCSECGKGDVHSKSVMVSFCWHCGAKMLKKGEG